jgi:hypothetical protein
MLINQLDEDEKILPFTFPNPGIVGALLVPTSPVNKVV